LILLVLLRRHGVTTTPYPGWMVCVELLTNVDRHDENSTNTPVF
jgi:hypothetical protein